jgi:hypothetical protein
MRWPPRATAAAGRFHRGGELPLDQRRCNVVPCEDTEEEQKEIVRPREGSCALVAR